MKIFIIPVLLIVCGAFTISLIFDGAVGLLVCFVYGTIIGANVERISEFFGIYG